MSTNGNDAASRRIALLSDVHGNLQAIEAVLADAREQGAEAFWCLGDLVGYGANPDECVEIAREKFERCLAGNHDLGVLGTIGISDFSEAAAAAARWTRDRIGAETREFLASLTPEASDAIGLYHGSPRDPVWEYVLSTVQAEDCMDGMTERVAACGHTHVASRFWRVADGETNGEQVHAGTTLDLSDGDWLLNPGSVGQPRDGDARASWVLLDLAAWTAEWRRVDYDVEAAAAAIEEAGLPAQLGARLFTGQ